MYKSFKLINKIYIILIKYDLYLCMYIVFIGYSNSYDDREINHFIIID